jgi:hypothetical protein
MFNEIKQKKNEKIFIKYNLNNIIKNLKKFGIIRPKENITYLNTFTVRKIKNT